MRAATFIVVHHPVFFKDISDFVVGKNKKGQTHHQNSLNLSCGLLFPLIQVVYFSRGFLVYYYMLINTMSNFKVYSAALIRYASPELQS